MNPTIVILAAGQGKRMQSALPKVLHPLAGIPLIQHVLSAAHALSPEKILIVHGHGGDQLQAALPDDSNVLWVKQAQQHGTGHAVAQTLAYLPENGWTLVLYGDVPLISTSTLQNLITRITPNSMALLTAHLPDPAGYGRIVRTAGQVQRIVEEKDADADTRRIQEINTGIMLLPNLALHRWLQNLSDDNAQSEYYLTDVISMAVKDGLTIQTSQPAATWEIFGVNDRRQLAALERLYQQHQAEKLMCSGVTLMDPQRLDIRGEVQAGMDCCIDVNVILEGQVTLGERVTIGPHTVIRNADIGDDVEIFSHCVIENVTIRRGCHIGPFARLRPETVLEEGVRIGNFVEVKKSTLGQDSKVNHLSYIGDSTVGKDVNIGAGTITCNYDGANKHRTTIGDNVFVGSDSQLVAPVTIGDGATVGAGSTITQNVPANALAISRPRQQIFQGWQRPQKKR